MNGQPLLPQHGAPLRLIVPGWYGMTNVKWLDSIRAIDTPFDGYQMKAYMFIRYPGTNDGRRTRAMRLTNSCFSLADDPEGKRMRHMKVSLY